MLPIFEEYDNVTLPIFEEYDCGVTVSDMVRLAEEMGEMMDTDGHSAHEFYVVTDNGVCQHDPSTDASEVSRTVVKTAFCHMVDSLSAQKLPGNFIVISSSNDHIIMSDHYKHNGDISVRISVALYAEKALEIHVHRRKVDLPKSAPSVQLNVQSVCTFLSYLSEISVCIGNPDDHIVGLIPEVGGGLSGRTGPLIAYREGDFMAQCGNVRYSGTLRHVDCRMLVFGARCSNCQEIRSILRKRGARNKQPQGTQPTSKTYPALEDQRLKLKQLQQDKRRLSRRLTAMSSKVSSLEFSLRQLIVREGEVFYHQQNSDIESLVEDSVSEFEKAFPADSFQRCFWEEQLRYNRLSDKKGMRWHPLIIRWCLYIRSKSSKAYDGLRQFLNLPSQRTLYDYSHFTEHSTGFQLNVTKQFVKEVDKWAGDESSQYVGILFDEVKVKSDLVYDKHTGELVGYVNLDNVSNELINLHNITQNDALRVAKFLLVVMVRGVCNGLKYPLSTFATDGITADFLYPLIWEAIEIVELDAKLKVLYLCCDGATPNRKFFKLHSTGNAGVHYCDNPFAEDDRKIYFISDPPHLLKTARNCFSNSHSHRHTRTLWRNGQSLSWMHIVDLFQDHCENSVYRLCPKLTRQHVDLTAFSAMKVNLAAQVFSKTVGLALSYAYGDMVSESAQFVLHMNRWFDLMNTKSLYECVQKRNDDLSPFADPTDERLHWLETAFIQYFDEWEQSVANRQGPFSKKERAQMLLSKQTSFGLRFTTLSIVACIRFMLSKGADFVLTSHFNQDPLEQHFGHCRHKGGANENPTVFEACHILNQIRTVNAEGLAPAHGNVTRRINVAEQLLDPTPLPRRPRNQRE